MGPFDDFVLLCSQGSHLISQVSVVPMNWQSLDDERGLHVSGLIHMTQSSTLYDEYLTYPFISLISTSA